MSRSSEPIAGVRPLGRLVRVSADLSSDYLEWAGVIPMDGGRGGKVRVGSWRERVDEQTLDDLRLTFSAEPELVPVDEDEAREAIRRLYGSNPTTAREVIEGLDGHVGPEPVGDAAIDDLVSQANEAPVVRLVNFLLLEALQARASDVHLEGSRSGLVTRYRIDGVLQDAPSPPPGHAAAVVSRIKIMAELDIAERRVPQDGRIRLKLQDRDVDVRVSTLPSLHGESVVLRLLDKEGGRIDLAELGMPPDTLERFAEVIARPSGIVLATGPTGSGKTTTLYAAIDRIRSGREKILTVEDPVEYELPGVAQTAVNERVGLTFATALRALLRQDPDVMLVGEIRDRETAQIATHAALTGHLVLSTLHTNDAPSALIRLIDLGIEPYLVASTVEAVLAQRLVRRICGACREETAVEPRLSDMLDGTPSVWRGRGCDACRGTGFHGRTGIYELLVLDSSLRRAVQHTTSIDDLAALARAAGMTTLREDGLRLVREGVTTPEEVLRLTAPGGA